MRPGRGRGYSIYFSWQEAKAGSNSWAGRMRTLFFPFKFLFFIFGSTRRVYLGLVMESYLLAVGYRAVERPEDLAQPPEI